MGARGNRNATAWARRRVALTTGLAVALLAGAGCIPQPPDDAFYRPAARSTAARPGDLLAAQPSRFTLDPVTLNPVPGVRSWKVRYRSTSATGAASDVSGTVLVPTTPWAGTGSRPLVTYGVGTRGVGDACAPSKTLAIGTDYEGGVIAEALQRGWAVAVSDMAGLGTPGVHTYEVGREQGTALLDIARAAEHLDGTGLDATTPVGIWGYSQGGTSAGWAAELAAMYAPELRIAGTAAGGVPADLRAVAANLDGNAFFSLLGLAAIGYDAAYPDLDLQRYLNASGRQLVAQNTDFCIVSLPGIISFLTLSGHHIGEYFTSTNPLTTPEWIARLDENRLGTDAPSAPVLLQHGLFDEVIPRSQALTLRSSWCRQGAAVTWGDLLGEHAIGILLSIQPALDFLSARFAGVPAPGNCGAPILGAPPG